MNLKLTLLVLLCHQSMQEKIEAKKLERDELDLNDEFKISLNDSSMILTDYANCLKSYNLMDCFKMFMITRIKGVVEEMEKNNSTGTDFSILNGAIVLKWRNDSIDHQLLNTSTMDLSRKLNAYVLQLFKSRSIQVKLLPGLGLDLIPKSVSDENGLVCFSAKTFRSDDSEEMDESGAVSEMRKKAGQKKKKKKGGGFNMMPMMIVPQMIMLGMMPFALANLKMMVMNAFMMNSMALNGAIAMTIRNLVFGPKQGPKIKYANYGYSKRKPNKKPELILHSPAAFVKKPYHEEFHVKRNEIKKHRLRSKPTAAPEPDYPPYSNPTYDTEDDSPVSFNNQHIQPSQSPYDENENDNFQAYNNIYLQSYQNDNHAGNSENKHSYSSKYKEEGSNYYPNHRLYR